MNNQAYRLAYANGYIFACGPPKILNQLQRIQSTSIQTDPVLGQIVVVPANRATYLGVEAVASPVSVSVDYQRERSWQMAVNPLDKAEMLEALTKSYPLTTDLLSHQTDTLTMLYKQRGMLVASEPGLGKTRIGWCAAYLWHAQRVLIVCPLSVIQTWRREWDLLWQPPRPFAISTLDSASVQERRTRLVGHGVTPACWPIACCLNFEVVHALEDAIRTYDPDVIIIDEGSRIKNHEAQVTKSLIQLCDKTSHVLVLNGTPYGNRGAADLYSQLRTLGAGIISETFWQFASTYCNMDLLQIGGRQIWNPNGCKAPVELMTRIEPVYFRVTREVCLQLPPVQRQVIKLQMSSSQRYLYDAVEKDGVGVLGNFLALDGARTIDIRLSQICSGFRPEYDPFGEEANESNYTLIPIEDEPKRQWIVNFVLDSLADNPSSRLIIWFRYNKDIEWVGRYLVDTMQDNRVAVVWGETSNEELEQIKESFNSRDEDGIHIILAQIKKLCFGHNLPACDTMIYYSNGYSYLERTQSEDRARRLNSEGGLTIYDLILEDSIDEEIKKALDAHQDFAYRMSPATIAV